MDERDFKRHLKDLAHGHHHPEEHDWEQAPSGAAKPKVKRAARAAPARKKRK